MEYRTNNKHLKNRNLSNGITVDRRHKKLNRSTTHSCRSSDNAEIENTCITYI